MQTERFDVAVVGGGLAGLTASVVAARRGARVALLERSEPGGRATTDVRNGFALNRGAHALYQRGPGRRVLDHLGVAVTGRAPANDGGSGLRDGALHRLPVSVGTLARTGLLGLRSKVALGRLLARLPKLDPEAVRGTSTAGWSHDLGLPDDARQVVLALVRLSSYSHAPDLLDAGAAVAQLQRALHGVTYLDGGWGSMVAALQAAAMSAGVVVRDATVAPGGVAGDGSQVVLADGGVLDVGAVVVAAGTPQVCHTLVAGAPATWRDLGPAVVVSCLDLGLAAPPPVAFVLGIDRPLYCSTHGPDARLAPVGAAVVHAMRNLGPDEDLTLEAARAELTEVARLAGCGEPVVSRMLHRMVVTGGMPLATRGGEAGRPPVAAGSGLFVAGDWVGPSGLLSDAALASGEAAGAAAAGHAVSGPPSARSAAR